MLPITNQRSFHIPHSIASAAAIVALVTALGWDVSDQDGANLNTADVPLEHAGSVTSQEPPHSGEGPAPARAGSAERETGGFSGLLPLVLPSIAGF